MSDDVVTPETRTRAEGAPRDLGACVYYALNLIQKGMGNGERAQLRRANPDEPYTPALWRVLAGLPDEWAGREEQERRWGVLLQAMSQAPELHAPAARLGASLAEAGYSELRLERLLRSNEAQLGRELRRMGAFMASKNVNLDWRDVARLLFLDDEDTRKAHRRAIARSYYGRLHAAAKS